MILWKRLSLWPWCDGCEWVCHHHRPYPLSYSPDDLGINDAGHRRPVANAGVDADVGVHVNVDVCVAVVVAADALHVVVANVADATDVAVVDLAKRWDHTSRLGSRPCAKLQPHYVAAES